VREFSPAFRFPILLFLALTATLPLAAQFTVNLNPKTDQAFDDYRKLIEAQLDGRSRFPAGLKPGQIQVLPARNQGAIEVPGGIIHDWIAATVVSGSTPENPWQSFRITPPIKTSTADRYRNLNFSGAMVTSSTSLCAF